MVLLCHHLVNLTILGALGEALSLFPFLFGRFAFYLASVMH